MNPETIYAGFNISVLPAWLLMLLAPRWKWTDRLVHRLWVPALLIIGWICLFLMQPDNPPGSGIATLAEFALLVSSPHGALLIWIQLITWDLFIGSWELRDAQRHRIHHGFVIPVLICTYLFGPAGLLIHFAVRLALRRDASLQECTAQPMDAALVTS